MGPVNMVKKSRRFGTALLLALSLVPILAMKAGIVQEGPGTALSMPDDWTHRHVVFSAPRSAKAAEKLQYEPRYQQQWLRHNRKLPKGDKAPASVEQFKAPAAGEQFPVPGMTSRLRAAQKAAERAGKAKPQPSESTLRQDWGSTLTAGGKVGDGMYPAKFTFNVAANPDCTSDYVVYNTSLATGAVAATRNGTFTAGTPAGSVTIGGTLTLTAHATDNTGTNFQATANTTTNATNLAAAIARNGASVGVTATSAAAVVTVTATTPGTAGNSIALADSLTVFTWAGGATILAGGVNPTKPSIVAYNNLYSTQVATLQGYCGGTGPTVRWSYASGTGSVVASTVLSLDGTKIIFVETKATGAVLHALQWKSGGEGTVDAPATPTLITSWSACSAGASCVVNLPFNGSQQATNSAPFYDYATDTAYVGDDTGKLHKFTPVLSGTPVEITSGGWPIVVDTGLVLNSPVFDPGSSRVFVTSTNKVCYVTSTPTKTCTAALANGGFSDAVIVDSAAGTVFAFSSLNGAAVHQYTTSLASPVTADVGNGIDPDPVFSGAFDNTYLTSVDSTGYMYVCGKASGMNPDRAALYRVPINLGVMNSAPSAGVNLVNAAGGCSPVTEFYNAGTGMDWIFLSVGNAAYTATGTACSTAGIGCVVSLNVTGTAWPPTSMTAGFVTPGNGLNPGASGIIVDNTAFTTTVPKTSLSAAMTNVATSLTVASATSFKVNDYIEVDAEAMWVTAIAGTTFTVTRAQLGTTAAAHLINTAVVDLRTTLLNGAIGRDNDTIITVDSTTTFNEGDYIQIGTEAMLISAKTTTTLTVVRSRLGSTAPGTIPSHADNERVTNLSAYPQAASIYLSFAANSLAAAQCNLVNLLGCAIKLTQDGLR
jgi:hypothetical protein